MVSFIWFVCNILKLILQMVYNRIKFSTSSHWIYGYIRKGYGLYEKTCYLCIAKAIA